MMKIIKSILFQLIIIVTITSCNNESDSYINPAPANNGNLTVKEQIYDLAEQYGMRELIHLEGDDVVKPLSNADIKNLKKYFELITQINNTEIEGESTLEEKNDVMTRISGTDYWTGLIKSNKNYYFNVYVSWSRDYTDKVTEYTVKIDLYKGLTGIVYEKGDEVMRWNPLGETMDYSVLGRLKIPVIAGSSIIVNTSVEVVGWVNTYTRRGYAKATVADFTFS